MSEAINLERLIKGGEFRERRVALGLTTRKAVAEELGVGWETVKSWEIGRRTIPRHAWLALERAEAKK